MSFLRENLKHAICYLAPIRFLMPSLKIGCWIVLLAVLPVWAAFTCAAQTVPNQRGSPVPPAGVAPFAGAVIAQWKGLVQVRLPGAPATHPAHGQILGEGTLLDTRDGQLLLALRSDESEILIQPHTRLILRAPQPSGWDWVQILLGKVRAYIRKQTGGAPPFQMGTPSAVIAVRGTRFDVEVNRSGISEVDVFQGLVGVASITVPGVSVLVRPGMSTRVGMQARPEPPVPTREIRPDVEVPYIVAKLEFARQAAQHADRIWDREFGERSHNEVSELVDESRESEKPNH